MTEANAQIESLHFQRAKQANTIKAFEDFLSQYPRSTFVTEARDQIEALYFQKALQKNTIESFEGFLHRYPKGKFTNKGRTKLNELRVIIERPFVLYFYFAPYGCPYSKRMAPKIERFYQEYGAATAFIYESYPRLAALNSLPGQKIVSDLISPHQYYFQSSNFQNTGHSLQFISASSPFDSIAQVPQRRFDVFGVTVHSPSYLENFRNNTGITFPVVRNPGLDVNTNRFPVTAIYNRQTRVIRVVAIGDVPYSTLVSKAHTVETGGRVTTTSTGGYCR